LIFSVKNLTPKGSSSNSSSSNIVG